MNNKVISIVRTEMHFAVMLNSLIHGYKNDKRSPSYEPAVTSDSESGFDLLHKQRTKSPIDIVIVGVTKGSGEAYVKNALRTNTMPKSVHCLGLDDVVKNGYPKFSSYIFTLPEIDYVSDMYFEHSYVRLMQNIFSSIKYEEQPVVLVAQNPKLYDRIIEAMAKDWNAFPKATHFMFRDVQTTSIPMSRIAFTAQQGTLDPRDHLTGEFLPEDGANRFIIHLGSDLLMVNSYLVLTFLLAAASTPDVRIVIDNKLKPMLMRAIVEAGLYDNDNPSNIL